MARKKAPLSPDEKRRIRLNNYARESTESLFERVLGKEVAGGLSFDVQALRRSRNPKGNAESPPSDEQLHQLGELSTWFKTQRFRRVLDVDAAATLMERGVTLDELLAPPMSVRHSARDRHSQGGTAEVVARSERQGKKAAHDDVDLARECLRQYADEYISVSSASKILGVADGTVRRYARESDGNFGAWIDGQYIFTRAEVVAFKKNVKPIGRPQKKSPDDP